MCSHGDQTLANTLRFPRCKFVVAPPEFNITWVGHATTLVEVDGFRLITDPILTSRVAHLRRRVEPGDIPPLDAVLISHLHMDHLHLRSLKQVAAGTQLICPAGASSLMRSLRADDPGYPSAAAMASAAPVAYPHGVTVDPIPLGSERRRVALATKGFMPPDEGDALHAAALTAGHMHPFAAWVEVGSYCGRSTVWLGDAAERTGCTLFAVDHHRGSEENQEGWEHHDASVVDPRVGKMDTLPFFRATIHDADLESSVVAVVGKSPAVAAVWTMPLGFLFIDGGHGEEPARLDFEGWARHVIPGGILAIHDVFPDPADGGRPPYTQIYEPAINGGGFTELSANGSLRILRRQ